MRLTTRDSCGNAQIECDLRTALNRLAQLEDWWQIVEKERDTHSKLSHHIMDMLDYDYVKVCRCKECKHGKESICRDGEVLCLHDCDDKYHPRNFYCAYGERRKP